jgi:hypothetical protein
MVNRDARSVNPTDVYRVLNTGIHTLKCTETQKITEMTIFVFISDPDSTGSNKSKRCLHKHHVKSSESESVNPILSTHSKMRDDHIYYDPVKNARFLDGENNPKDWAALWKMDVHCTGGHWAALREFSTPPDEKSEDKPKRSLTLDEVKRLLERQKERQKPDPVIKEPTAPSVPEPVPPLPIPTRFNIKYPKDGVLKVRLDKGRSSMVWIDTDASGEFERDNLFKFEIINDDQRLNTPAVRLKKQYPVSCSIKYIFFEAEPKAEVGDKGTIKFSLERPATETEEHMRWITFVKFEVVSSEDDDCEPLCVIA